MSKRKDTEKKRLSSEQWYLLKHTKIQFNAKFVITKVNVFTFCFAFVQKITLHL